MPDTAARIFSLLDVPGEVASRWEWGTALSVGHRTKPPEILFPRIDVETPGS
jgi:methionyl-tRNA synthetase